MIERHPNAWGILEWGRMVCIWAEFSLNIALLAPSDLPSLITEYYGLSYLLLRSVENFIREHNAPTPLAPSHRPFWRSCQWDQHFWRSHRPCQLASVCCKLRFPPFDVPTEYSANLFLLLAKVHPHRTRTTSLMH